MSELRVERRYKPPMSTNPLSTFLRFIGPFAFLVGIVLAGSGEEHGMAVTLLGVLLWILGELINLGEGISEGFKMIAEVIANQKRDPPKQ